MDSIIKFTNFHILCEGLLWGGKSSINTPFESRMVSEAASRDNRYLSNNFLIIFKQFSTNTFQQIRFNKYVSTNKFQNTFQNTFQTIFKTIFKIIFSRPGSPDSTGNQRDSGSSFVKQQSEKVRGLASAILQVSQMAENKYFKQPLGKFFLVHLLMMHNEPKRGRKYHFIQKILFLLVQKLHFW